MQLSTVPVNSGLASTERPAPGALQRPDGDSSRTPLAARPASPESPLRSGLRCLDTQLNRQAAAMQQTLGFVDQAQSQLKLLKTGLSAVVAEQQAPADSVHAQLQQFAAQWDLRAEATAGGLDADLKLVGAGLARQRFSVRGLDVPDALASQERLLFTVRGRAATPVVLNSDLSLSATAQRFDQALAPFGVRVVANVRGTLQFSAAESDWPALRDSLMVKGEGRIFPTGQFNRVRCTVEPNLVRPETWRIDDTPAARQTLREVVLTSKRLRIVAHQASEALSGLAQTVGGVAEAPASERNLGFAKGFSEQAQNASFALLANALPACLGLNRERVTALLSQTG